MSVATATAAPVPNGAAGTGAPATTTASSSTANNARSPSRSPTRALVPSHSILRPCNAKGIPVGPPIIPPPNVRSVSSPGLQRVPLAAAVAPAAGPPDAAQPAAGGPVDGSGVSNSSNESLTTTSTVPSMSPSAMSNASTFASSSDPFCEETESSFGGSTPRSSMYCASPKIRFGSLPERPPELRRRNSITLGVLARKNMLTAQGTVAGGSTVSANGTRKIMMTDAEWEAYQQKFASKNGNANAVDLGQVMSSGAKKLWGKVRRGSNTSQTSNSSSTPSVTGRGRSDSTGAIPVSPRAGPMVDVAPAIVEEEEPHSAPASPRQGALQMSGTTDGDETPRRGRSPSPPPLSLQHMEEVSHHHGHRGRSPSPPPHPLEDEDEEDDDEERFANGQDDDENRSQNSSSNNNEEDHRTHDDADAEHLSHHNSTAAALGFELRDYKKRPAWDRRGSAHSIHSNHSSSSLNRLADGHTHEATSQV